MNLLIIGGTGTISGGIAVEALRQGHEVTILNRGSRNYRIPDSARVIHADINDVETMARIVENNYFDIIVDPLVIQTDQLIKHLKIFDGKCGKYVFISSCCAFGGNHNDIISEGHLMRPQSKYGVSKYECEEYLRNVYKSDYLIIRPYITYGDIRIPIPFACRDNPYTVIERIEKEKPLVCFDIKNHKTRHNLMDARDFSRIVVGLLDSGIEKTSYNVCGDNVYSWDMAYEILYREIGKPKHLYYVERSVFRYIDRHLYEDILYDKDCDGTVYSGEKAKMDAKDAIQQITLEKGIQDLVHYLRSECAQLPIEEQYNYRTDLLLVNAVKETDCFLREYISSLEQSYVMKLEADWKKLKKKYWYDRLNKYPIVNLSIRIRRRLRAWI